MEERVTKIPNLSENGKYQGKRIKFDGQIIGSIMDMVLRCLCGGIRKGLEKSSGDRDRGQNWSYGRHTGYILDSCTLHKKRISGSKRLVKETAAKRS